MPQIHIIGTSHISDDSVKQIKKEFLNIKPDIIAIELDKNRLNNLLNAKPEDKNKMLPLSAIKQIGLTGYLFATIGKLAQKKLGNIVGTNPGQDMKQGAILARNNKLQLLLLDQDLRLTLKKLSQTMKGKEKRRIIYDIFFSWINKKNKQNIKIDLSKIPKDELIITLLKQTKKRYPSLYKTLVHDRNTYMAKNLALCCLKNPEAKILVIIGAGHKEGLLEEFKKTYESLRKQIINEKKRRQEQKEQKEIKEKKN